MKIRQKDCLRDYLKKISNLSIIIDILPDKDRITYCRFRTGNHRLPIETGRWYRIERQNRHCNLCQYQALGSEFHYILQCRSPVDIRKQF